MVASHLHIPWPGSVGFRREKVNRSADHSCDSNKHSVRDTLLAQMTLPTCFSSAAEHATQATTMHLCMTHDAWDGSGGRRWSEGGFWYFFISSSICCRCLRYHSITGSHTCRASGLQVQVSAMQKRFFLPTVT